MRILMVLDKPFPPDLRVENEARSLVGAGHEVRVLSVGPDDRAREEEVFPGVFVRREVRSQSLVNRMRALAATWPLTDRFYAGIIEKAHRDRPFDAVHVHDLYLAGGGIRAARRLGIPCIVDLHEHWTRVLDDYEWSSGFPRRWIVGRRRWRRYERRRLERADAIAVVGEDMAAHYAYAGRPVISVPNYVSLEGYGALHPGPIVPGLAVPSILYAGGLVPNRGLDTAIRAMPRILRAVGPARLDIVGDGVDRSALERLAAGLGIGDAVRFAGWVPLEQIPGWVLQARVCINLLRRTGQTEVALSHKLFQYMLAERPVVVTGCVAMARVVRDAGAGIVVPDRDVEAYAAAVIQLLTHPEEAAQFGRQGRQAVLDRYNWDEAVKPLLAWYASRDPGATR